MFYTLLETSVLYYVTAFVIMVSLMHYQYWFWYPPAVPVTSWYWFPRWLSWGSESCFPERFDDKSVRKPLWASYGQGRIHHATFYFALHLTQGSEMLLQGWFMKHKLITSQSVPPSIGCSPFDWIVKTPLWARGLTQLSFTWPRP